MREAEESDKSADVHDLVGEEGRYRAIFDTAVDAIVVIDEMGVVRALNPSAQTLFGYDAAEVIGQNVNMLMAEPYRSAHDGYLDRYRRTGERRIIGVGRAVSGQRKDGSTFPLELSVAEWRENGERFFTGIMRDVTERTRTEERLRLMVNELNHRVKNTLATVQSVALQTLRNAVSLDSARTALNERLLALAKAHDVLTRESWDGADLADIVASAIEAHGAAARVKAEGPHVRLQPKPAVALAMALHELFTNAAKYGALRHDDGVIHLTWSAGGAPGALRLVWQEHGGPAVAQPKRRGFGARLIDGLARDMAGAATLEFRPEGLRCVVTAGDVEDGASEAPGGLRA
ncbi:sensor histidine kinase [Phenylobacterium sp.]|uniref:sensor histidine kinase n=1 Tax=Phenylobacterium sp. TaxID=1871053 RepID=UPI0035ADDA86